MLPTFHRHRDCKIKWDIDVCIVDINNFFYLRSNYSTCLIKYVKIDFILYTNIILSFLVKLSCFRNRVVLHKLSYFLK